MHSPVRFFLVAVILAAVSFSSAPAAGRKVVVSEIFTATN